MAATELVQVQFHGDVLDCVQQDGKVWFSIRRGCENLELAVQGQLEKLKAKAWAVVKEIVMTGPDGKTYTMACIDLDSLPGWLFSIDARKVKEQSREKLARYQREAARVLADHFFRRANDVSAMLSTLLARVESLEGRAASQLPGPRSYNAGPLWTVQDLLREMGWFTTSSRQRANIRDRANTAIRLHTGQEVELVNGWSAYTRAQLSFVDRSIRIERMRAELEEAERGMGVLAGYEEQAA